MREFLVLFVMKVMKMVMTLTASESGCIHYVKRAGAVLEPGCIIGKLQLDDPSRVQQVHTSITDPVMSGLHVMHSKVKWSSDSSKNLCF